MPSESISIQTINIPYSETSPQSSSTISENRGDLIDPQLLPEAAKQPILETIDTKMSVHIHDGTSTESPRSIDNMKQLNSAPPQQRYSPQNAPPRRPAHRRAQSAEELPQVVDPRRISYGNYPVGYGYYGVPSQHQSLHHTGMHPHGTGVVMQHTPPRTPPPVTSSSGSNDRRPSHNRSRSWNPPPMMGYNQQMHVSAAGNPLIPVLHDISETRPSGGTRHRRSLSNGSPAMPPTMPTRQRANSASGSSSMYGSMDEKMDRSPNFSPRNEIMSITKGFRSSTPPPISPTRDFYPRTSPPRITPPRTSPGSPLVARQAHFHEQHEMDASKLNFSSSPGGFPGVRFEQPESIPTEKDSLLGGGEAVYSAQKRSKQRKMHMRQRSAQIYMEDFKGVPQPLACRDILFVLLFLFHLVGMMFLGTTYGHEAIATDEMMDTEETAVRLSYQNVLIIALLCGAFSVVFSLCTLALMMAITDKIVQLSLMLTIALSFAWGTIGIGVSPKNFVPITGIIALALSVGYAFVVWDRIPFAAANLKAALAALRSNAGTVVIAFLFQMLALGYSVYYTFVVVGVYDALLTGDLVLSENMKIFVYIMLGVSYYWTFHVLMNVVKVTVAGTIGGWWFQADSEHAVCNDTVSSSFFSAIFYSFGSICFGSLLVGPVRLLHLLSAFVRPSQEQPLLMCLHECIHCIQTCVTNCVDNLSNHFNPWALTYVGLYGYGLLDAGHNATDLFDRRGWTMIVSDDLVGNVLLLFCIVVGGVTGCFGVLIQRIDELAFTNALHDPTMTSFLIGLCIGLVSTSVLFAIISGSVNSVIVCFAGSPLEFEEYHPELSADMRTAWREVWPGCMDVVDPSMILGAHPLLV